MLYLLPSQEALHVFRTCMRVCLSPQSRQVPSSCFLVFLEHLFPSSGSFGKSIITPDCAALYKPQATPFYAAPADLEAFP